jgi:hypothetical protein
MVLLPGCACCVVKPPCDVSRKSQWSLNPPSVPGPFNIIFPEDEYCVRFEIVVTTSASQTITISFEGIGLSSDVVYSGAGGSSVVICALKQAGYTSVRISIDNFSGSAGYVQTDCEACDCNPAP